jgi:hypothetical protein
MKKHLAYAAIVSALSLPAFANSNGNDVIGNTGIAAGGDIVGNINTGAGSGSTHLSNTSTNTNTSTSSARQGQFQAQSQNARSSVRDSGNSSNTNVIEAAKRAPVSTAYAAPLVAADDTCMGSSSVGAQGVGFGLSVGSTWHDDDCVRRKDARELHNMGYKPAALALMCQNAAVRKAMAAAGTSCPTDAADAEPVASESARWDGSSPKH